jgi:hypothetical protein
MQQVNLYRPIFRKQEKKFSAVAMAQAGAAIVVGVIVIYGLTAWQVHRLREESARAQQQLNVATARLTESVQKFGGSQAQPAEAQIQQMEQQVAARLRVRDVMARGLFSNTTGYSNFLTAFARQRVNGVWLTGFNIVGAGEDLRLQGRTSDPAQVPRYIQRLSGEQVLSGKEFQVFVMSRPEKKPDEPAQPPYIEFLLRTNATKDEGKS